MTRTSTVGAALVAVLALTATAQAARNAPDPDPVSHGAAAYGMLPLDTGEARDITTRRGDGALEIRIKLLDAVPAGGVRLRCLGGEREGPVVAVLGGLAEAGRAADGARYTRASLKREDVIATDGSSDACPYVIETLEDLAGAIEFGDIYVDLPASR